MRESILYIFIFIIGWAMGYFTDLIREFFLEKEDDELIRY